MGCQKQLTAGIGLLLLARLGRPGVVREIVPHITNLCSTVVKAGLAGMLLVTYLIGAGAHAASKSDSDEAILATKAAMDAFFSIEGSNPAGVSKLSAPNGFKGGGEFELIAYLSKQRARGARWDRYRYLGTLLHHSLRVGFDDVARWLLRNGADPTQRVGDDGLDALGVAVRMERWSLVQSLLRHPIYQRMTTNEVAERLWAGAQIPAHRAALLRLRPVVPTPSLGKAGSPLLTAALCSADLFVARRLLAQVSTPVACSPNQIASISKCPHHTVWTSRPGRGWKPR